MANQADFTLITSDTLPILKAQLIDQKTRLPIADITGSTVVLRLREKCAAESTDIACTITDGPEARVEVPWTTSDTDTPGDYEGRFKVTYPSMAKLSVPSVGDCLLIRILPEC